MEPASAQLSAAIYSLIAALLGRRHDGPFLLWCVYNLSFARWGLEGAIYKPHVQALFGIPSTLHKGCIQSGLLTLDALHLLSLVCVPCGGQTGVIFSLHARTLRALKTKGGCLYLSLIHCQPA